MNTAKKAPSAELVSILRFIRNRKACRRWSVKQITRFGAAVQALSKSTGIPFVKGLDPGFGPCKLYRRALCEIVFSEVNR